MQFSFGLVNNKRKRRKQPSGCHALQRICHCCNSDKHPCIYERETKIVTVTEIPETTNPLLKQRPIQNT